MEENIYTITTHIPIELIYEILSYIDICDLFVCSRSNSVLRYVSQYLLNIRILNHLKYIDHRIYICNTLTNNSNIVNIKKVLRLMVIHKYYNLYMLKTLLTYHFYEHDAIPYTLSINVAMLMAKIRISTLSG
jgi:hypothetical protein